jgi:hypothetical protein
MIEFNGVNLTGDIEKLHFIAFKLGISRSWFRLNPIPCYDVICPFKRQAVINYLKRRN